MQEEKINKGRKRQGIWGERKRGADRKTDREHGEVMR